MGKSFGLEMTSISRRPPIMCVASGLQTIMVSGKRRVPETPARRMAFLFIYLALGLRSFFHAPAHQQFRPFPPKTCACGQIDPKLFTDQSDRFSRNRAECRF